MGNILVVGSIALDTVETPFGKVTESLGGSAVYFSTAASLYSKVSLVGVVGNDFPPEHIQYLSNRQVDVRGLQVKNGKTFRWSGRYDYDLNQTHTLDTQLNVFADFHPELPAGYEDSEFVFLANIDPDLQYEVLQQVPGAKLTMLDTMDFWIRGKRESLVRTMKAVDIITMNESEARMFAGTNSLQVASKRILELGPKVLIIKKGEYGAVMFSDSTYFVAPAYPLEEVWDPTGAGDTFAGGFMGYLAQSGDPTVETMKKAIVHGSVLASFTVEGFSVDRLKAVTREEIALRYSDFVGFTHFHRLDEGYGQTD